MFSSVGQIVGLIEIELAESDAPFSAAVQMAGDFDPDALDASLEDLLARLVGRPGSYTGQTSRVGVTPHRPTNRLPRCGVCPAEAIVLGADLTRLEAELADETRRLRLQLADAAVGARKR